MLPKIDFMYKVVLREQEKVEIPIGPTSNDPAKWWGRLKIWGISFA